MKLSQINPNQWDELKYGYVAPEQLNIKGDLKLHKKATTDLDPFTYEVIRHSLFNVNEEHGATIQRISGSPVAVYALDLNPSILTEDGEFVYFGPYMQYMSGVTDLTVKWTLENRSANPGIKDGDMFLCNDPWIGAAHQMDTILACPVFHEGELFCWVTNCLHQYDVGGITPSSFCTQATSSFDEGILIPPTKIVEGGEIRKDIEDLYLRASRKPNLVALDFRAQMAGNNVAKERILKLIEQYGAAEVKGAMRKVIDIGEQSFLAKMKQLPDGIYRDRTFIECSHVGDREAHEVRITLTKKGTELTFDNEGTAPQGGGMNSTYSGWRGSVMIALNQLLCWDQHFAIGGALRHVKFDPVPGTLNCASHPASVSTATMQAMEISLYPTYNVISKLIYADAEMRKDIMCIGGTSQFPTCLFQGIDQYGNGYGYGLIDPIGGAIGAFSTGDGINSGGQSRTPICKLPNIEHTEHNFPMLFLYRKEVIDSGGPGKWRGGQSAESCWVPHNTEAMRLELIMSGAAIPTSTGMMGGYPAIGNGHQFKYNTDVQERFRRSNLVTDITELTGDNKHLELREPGFMQTTDDVYTVWWTGAGGFGDPLHRSIENIQADLDNFAISEKAAYSSYGAIINKQGLVDTEKTKVHRQNLLQVRLDRLPKKEVATRKGKVILELTYSIDIRQDKKGAYHACKCCGGYLAVMEANYKTGCLVDIQPVQKIVPKILDANGLIDHTVEFRLFLCPTCGAQIDNEVGLDDLPYLRDIEILNYE